MKGGELYGLGECGESLKEVVMVWGLEGYLEIVKCLGDEEVGGEGEGEFREIEWEMRLVEEEEMMNSFEGMGKDLLKEVGGVEVREGLVGMGWGDGMKYYGSEKGDLGLGMKLVEVMDVVKGYGLCVLENGGYMGGMCGEGGGE